MQIVVYFISKETIIILAQRRNAYLPKYATLLRYKYFNPLEYTVCLIRKKNCSAVPTGLNKSVKSHFAILLGMGVSIGVGYHKARFNKELFSRNVKPNVPYITLILEKKL